MARDAGGPTPGSSTGVPAAGSAPDAAGVVWWARAATLVFALVTLVEAIGVVGGAVPRPAVPVALGVVAAAFALSWYLAVAGRTWPAVWISLAAFAVFAIVGSTLFALLFVTIVALPAATTVIAVPYLEGRRLGAMIVIVWAISIAGAAVGLALFPPAGSDQIGAVAAVLSLVVIAAVASWQLVRVSTEFRRERDAARTSEAQYRALFDGSPVGAFVFDPDSMRLLAVNLAAERMYGVDRSVLLGMTLRDLVDPTLLPRFDALRASLCTDELVALPPDWRHRRPDGRSLDVQEASLAVPFAGRRARLSVVVDVTEQRRLARAAEEAAARLAEAQAVGHVGSWEVEAGPIGLVDGTLRWSAEGLRIVGLPPDTGVVAATRFWDIVHPDDLPMVKAANREVEEHGEAYEIEHRIVRPDGEVRRVHERGTILRDVRGAAVRHVGTIEDVTERRELERRLAAAERLETVGRLASGVAHDFNNLLMVISGNAEIALSTLGPDDPAREPVEAIAGAAQRSAVITQDLLAFGRRRRSDPRPARLDGAVDAVIASIRDIVGPAIEVVVTHAPDPAVVRLDQADLARILLNLATNAHDAMTDGGTLTIATRTRVLPDGVRRGVLTVTDTGSGMVPGVMEHAFEPFYSTKTVGGTPASRPRSGSGLGLAIVAGLVDDAGGTIEVESAVGRGTMFRIELPVSAEAVEPEQPHAPVARPHRRASILVVEDDVDVATLVRTALVEAGHSVTTAASGDEAWSRYLSQRGSGGSVAGTGDGCAAFDVVVSDVVMPGMSGSELARRLAARRPRIPVILMSGYADDIDALMEPAEPAAFLDKPFTIEQLLQAVEDALPS